MAHKRGRNRPKNKNVNTQNTKMEQNAEQQDTEAKAEESVQNDENVADTDTNAAKSDSKGSQDTENVADSTADQQAEAENVADAAAQQDELKQKYDELNDKYLRLMAEFDNYRKRTLKEKMDLTKYAEEDVLKGILKVVDDMERAINNLDTAADMNAVKEGVELIYKKFKSFLETRGLKEVEAMHQELDTDKHEAVAKFAAPSEDLKGKIIDVVEKGYYLHDKIIRYAKVVIGE